MTFWSQIARYAYRRGIQKGSYSARGQLWRANPIRRGPQWYNWHRRGNRMYLTGRDGVIKRTMHINQFRARRAAPWVASYGFPAAHEARNFRRQSQTYGQRRYNRYRNYY